MVVWKMKVSQQTFTCSKNSGSIKKMCEICSKLTLKTSGRHSNSCWVRKDKSLM